MENNYETSDMNQIEEVPPREILVKANKVGERVHYFFIMSFIFGLLFTLCFYDFDQNYNGIVYPLFVILLFSITIIALKKLGKVIENSSYLFAAVAILLGISSFLTMNFFVVFFNTVGIMVLYGLFIAKAIYSDLIYEPFYQLRLFLEIGFKSIGNMSLPFRHIFLYNKQKHVDMNKVSSIIKGLALSILLLIIVVPLLVSSDLIFADIVGSIIPDFSYLLTGNWLYYVILITASTLAFYGLLCILSEDLKTMNIKSRGKKDPLSILIMTWIVTVIYMIFCIIQIIYLIGGNFFQLPNGITYADYARQGFLQLVIVAAINMGLVLICVNIVKEHKGLMLSLNLISGSTFIMIASATYRMILYIHIYHFTFLRILVLWFLAVLTICMVGTVYYIYHKTFSIYKYIFYTVLISYIIFAFGKPDYIVAKYNVNHMEEINDQDLDYLMNLSMDATPVIADINESQYKGRLIDDYYNAIIASYKNEIRYYNISKITAYGIAKNRGSK